jgi:hypothetical protein
MREQTGEIPPIYLVISTKRVIVPSVPELSRPDQGALWNNTGTDGTDPNCFTPNVPM